MSVAFAYYTTAVTILLVLPRGSVTQNGNPSSVQAPTVEVLDNRSTYCLGETAHIRCNITGSGNDSNLAYDWIINTTSYNPDTIAQSKPGHTVSSSDRFALQAHPTTAYTANYSCSQRIGSWTIQSRAKLITFASEYNKSLRLKWKTHCLIDAHLFFISNYRDKLSSSTCCLCQYNN